MKQPMDMTMPMNVPYPLKLRIEDFELLQREGVFDGVKKVELIEGTVVAMNAEYRPHTYVKSQLMYRLQRRLEEMGSNYIAVVEPTLALPPYNLPEPDVMVVDAPSVRDYFRIEHVAIVIEVADSTIAGDIGPKQQMYAANAIPEYWVVDIVSADVHQFWAPVAGRYTERRTARLGDTLASATMPTLAINSTGM